MMTHTPPEDWCETTLGEITDKIGSGATPKGGSNAYKQSGISLIRSQNILDLKFSKEGLAFIDDAQAEKLSNVEVKKNDLLINITGDSVARSCLVNKDFLPARVNQHVSILRANPNKASYKFLAYKIQFLKPELLSQSEIGATRRAITKGMLENLELLLPPLPEQEAIAEVLSSLDDKVDLLHRQNKTLEALAETLFRQWFIEDADPDWAEKPLDKVADYLNGLACQKYPPKNDSEKLPVLKIRELKGGIGKDSDWVTSNVPEQYLVKAGDIIFSWSASLMVKIWDGEDCVLNQHLFKITSENFPKWYYYLWTKHHLNEFIAIAETMATTMGHIKRSDLAACMCTVPDDNSLPSMNEKMVPIFTEIELNSKQIQTLEAMRETLLPKLISGQVRVNYKGEIDE
jgi:type I restriction enzyme S subunit